MTPKKKFNCVITCGNVCFNFVDLMKLTKKVRGDVCCINFLASNGEVRVGNDIGGVEGILVTRIAIQSSINIVDEPFIKWPSAS